MEEYEYKDINWSVNFEVTVNGETVNFTDLPDDAKQAILNFIAGDSYSGTFVC